MSRILLVQPVSHLLLASLLFIGLSATITPFYPGATLSILIFLALGSGMLAAAVVTPPSFFVLTVTLFLFVGFVGKALFHFTFSVPLIEPVGNFTNEWDRALGFASSGLGGVLAAILSAQLFPSFSKIRQARTPVLVSQIVAAALICLLGAALVLYWANYEFHILRIGFPIGIDIHPRLYAPLSFAITWGAILGGLTLALWSIETRGWGYQLLLYVAAMLGFLAAASMASRIQFLLYVLAAVWVILWRWRQVRSWLQVSIAFCIAVGLFGISLLIVSLERTYDFVLTPEERAGAIAVPSPAATVSEQPTPPAVSAPSVDAPSSLAAEEPTTTAVASEQPRATPLPAPSASTHAPAAQEVPTLSAAPAAPDLWPSATSILPEAPERMQEDVGLMAKMEVVSGHRLTHLVHELRSLVVMRWVGLEGVMTTAAEPEQLGGTLLWAGLKEDPAAGTNAIYQRMSGDRYRNVDYFTFLTLPGPVGIASYSGSPTTIFSLVFLLVLAGHALEWLTASLTKNLAATSVAGVSLAYLVVQMGFPWTLFIYALELALAVTAIALSWWILNHLATSRSNLRSGSHSGSEA